MPSKTETPKAGGKYQLDHERFGTAVVRVTSIGGVWATIEVVSGILRGMSCEHGPGDSRTVRINGGNWTPIPDMP